jgi:hypothetical protein
MTALTRNPTNPNFLHPNKFILNFGRVPNVQYFCQSVSVPGISTSEIPRNNPFVDLYSPGEKLIYDIMNVTFYIDEELKAWLEIHDWLRAMTFPTDFAEYENLSNLNNFTRYKQTNTPQFSDGTLTLLSSSNKPYYNFKFIDLFPVSLSSFVVSTGDSPDTILTADASFRFAYYNVDKLF